MKKTKEIFRKNKSLSDGYNFLVKFKADCDPKVEEFLSYLKMVNPRSVFLILTMVFVLLLVFIGATSTKMKKQTPLFMFRIWL